ncbi:hypothetical protein NQ317_000595 [Molorchus minor]|uniref:RING-type domain-containing protein n=1 Tax=Molorchus minor TaxID=1323400 RepID=A0ABQ9J0M3_9CUCU|nr:hypothetical protein NQ317_000595 [Molorchus minor]
MNQQGMQTPHSILRELFPGITDQRINEIMVLVEEDNPGDSFEGKLENMIILLADEGAWGGPISDFHYGNSSSQPPPVDNDSQLNLHYEQLCLIFEDACPDFLWQYCKENRLNFDIEVAIDEFNERGYKKIEIDPLTIWEQLRDALPDADPAYLKTNANNLARLPPQELNKFLQNAIDKVDYPTMQDYLKQKKENDELAIYKTPFNVEKFLEIIPNLMETFSDPQRKKCLDENSTDSDIKYAMTFLYNQYSFIRKKYIDQLFAWRKKDLVEVCERLDKMRKSLRRPRPRLEVADTNNVALLQEVTYLKNRRALKNVLKLRDEHYRLAKEEARKYNLLESCGCCFDEELIPEECYCCMKGCMFCKECVRTGAEAIVGNAQFKFPCFNKCDSEFSLHTLQMVLPRKTFDRIVQKIASEDIRRANVDGLETCPFCDFAMVLPDNEKIFKCINQECLIESCRTCRHKSHIPLRCNEIEYDEDVRRRTYIENKMTEALTRTCYNCAKKFIKSSGCNKMVCVCGAKMCYQCGAAVSDYRHFGSGKCPLHSNDAEIDLRRVLEGGTRAKQELGDVQIKFDPTVNIEDFYRA